MLCSERELGLSDDHSGIFLLPPHLQKGVSLGEVEGIRDLIFDVNVPANRGDCLSILGIAREVASLVGGRVELPEIELSEDEEPIDTCVDLDVLSSEACPRYVLRMLKGTSCVPSPFFIRNRLYMCGMRPINAIVDVTNYVMLELGQPLHAFDYERIRKGRIVVKVNSAPLPFRTLDGEERVLEEGDLLICDGDGPVAIAGVMGGENSEITGNTRHVLLESAFFNPLYIRRTSRRLNIRSEASLRFERGIDIGLVDYASKRAIGLMKETAGGTILRGKREVMYHEGEKKIFVSLSKLEKMMGATVGEETFAALLGSIGFGIERREEGAFSISVPSFRLDVSEFMDIVEEVARLYGYERIPPKIPVGMLRVAPFDSSLKKRRRIKEFFVSAGFFEVMNFAFFSKRDLQNHSIKESDGRYLAVSILNPVSRELELMRTFLLPGLLKNVSYNLNRGVRNLRIFEIGKVFTRGTDGSPEERYHIAFLLTGKEREYFWREEIRDYDFFDLKGVAEAFSEKFLIDISFVRGREPFLLEGTTTDLFLGGQKIGSMGEVKGETLERYGIEQKVFACEMDLQRVLSEMAFYGTFQEIPRFPPVVRDFSFYVDEDVPVELVREKIRSISPLIKSVGIFDVYKKEKRSVSFRVVFQSLEGTLTEERISELQASIIQELVKIEGVNLRT
jgi:phenylalanyl-tRNA synthetase beta chain